MPSGELQSQSELIDPSWSAVPGFHMEVTAPREDGTGEKVFVNTQTGSCNDWPSPLRTIRIEKRRGWRRIEVSELFTGRDLFYFLVRREVKVRYAQSVVGIGWAVLQPLFAMLVFTLIFGRLVRVSSDGVPYALLSFAGLVPWMYFANAVTDGVNSIIVNAPMLSKVYFPRLFIPLSAVAARLVDFGVAFLLLLCLQVHHGLWPTWGVVALPWAMLIMIATAVGTACGLATFAIQYRDVKHALGFMVQLLMYAAPVVYPASLIPAEYQNWFALNPMVAVIETMRAALLGTHPIPWNYLAIGTLSSSIIFVCGVLCFCYRQPAFADVA